MAWIRDYFGVTYQKLPVPPPAHPDQRRAAASADISDEEWELTFRVNIQVERRRSSRPEGIWRYSRKLQLSLGIRNSGRRARSVRCQVGLQRGHGRGRVLGAMRIGSNLTKASHRALFCLSKLRDPRVLLFITRAMDFSLFGIRERINRAANWGEVF